MREPTFRPSMEDMSIVYMYRYNGKRGIAVMSKREEGLALIRCYLTTKDIIQDMMKLDNKGI